MRRKTRKNVGVIGLGIIGSRAAASLRAAGFHTFVWNRTAKPVPNFLGSAAEVAACCDIIQLFVGDAPAVMEVLNSMSDKLTSAHIIVCSATIGPEATLEAAKLVEKKGARFLDAPFTGSKMAAERHQLVYYVGGDDATFLPARPMLEATSQAIVRTGGIGDAALIKVVTNQIAAVSIQVLAEALAIVQKAGVAPEVFTAALEHNAARSGTMDLKLPKMIAGDYEPHFSLKHMFKDVQLSIQLANSMNLDTPTAAVTSGVLFGAIKRGWGDLDFASLYRFYHDETQTVPALAAGSGRETPETPHASSGISPDAETGGVHEAETKPLSSGAAAGELPGRPHDEKGDHGAGQSGGKPSASLSPEPAGSPSGPS